MELSLLTWNIWFDEQTRDQRTRQLMQEIKMHNPDVIALQEVVKESLEIIERLRGDYNIIGTPLIYRYDTVILIKSRYAVLNWSRYVLPETSMGRNLLLAEIAFDNRRVHIGTFHLESAFRNQQDEQKKINQLQYIEAITPPNSVLMGDTNFKNTTFPEIQMMDIFEKIDKPQAYEYTYDGKTNRNIQGNLRSRLDRIYLKNDCKISAFYLTGMDNQCSDHYGVYTCIK